MQWRGTMTAVLSTALYVGGAFFSPVSAQATIPVPVAAPTETLVLRVLLNSVDKGDVFAQRDGLQKFFLKIEDLKAFGLRDPSGSVAVFDGESHLALETIKGVSSSYDPKTLILKLVAEPQLLANTTLSARDQRRQVPVTPSGNSAFFNYALTSSQGGFASTNSIGAAGELGIKWDNYLLLTDAATVRSANGNSLVRLMSSVTRDDRKNLRRFVFGDFLTPSRDFSNSVNLGGISISKNYRLDPYFVRFPTQSLSGSVASPSDLEVYLDGQRIRTERLAPGNFQLQDIIAYGGSRNVQLILRDAFGRVQQLNYSLYFTDQPLQEGLHEYSYNFGAVRRQYGLQSNNYGPAAFTMFHRYGYSNPLTVGWRAEVTRDLVNTGPTLTAVLGDYGVINLGLTASSFEGTRGHASLGSYNFDSQNWAVGFFMRRDSSGYASLGEPVAFTNRRYEASISSTYRLPHNASISASRSVFTTRLPERSLIAQTQTTALFSLGNRRVTSLAYSKSLDVVRAQFTATLSRIQEDAVSGRNEVFVGLNFLLDQNYSAATNYRVDRNGHSESARFTKGLPIGEGLGYDLSVDRSSMGGGSEQFRSNIQYNAPAAAVRFERGQYTDQGQTFRDQRISVAGSVVAAGGQIGFSRPVTDSYAIVKVGEVQGVAVLVEGQPAGLTNQSGIAVLPSLNANYENNVSIASDALPINLSLTSTLKKVAPDPRSGAFLDFNPIKTQAFTGTLFVSGDGTVKPVEFSEIVISVGGVSQTLPTGRGGEFYVENIPSGTYSATAGIGTVPCRFQLIFPTSDEMFVDLGSVTCAPQPTTK